MINLIAAILPIILYLFVLNILDSFSLVKWKHFYICNIYGFVCCLVLFVLTRFVTFPQVCGLSITPLVEEIFKGGLMIYLVKKRRIRFLAETLIYGAAVGGGFAFIENIIYVITFPEMGLGTAIFRGLGCAFMHMGCTALIATIVLLSNDKPAPVFVPLAFIPSLVLHMIQNFIVENGILPFSLLLFVTIGVFFGIFLFLFDLGDRKVYNWMDRSISNDVTTLCSIKKGDFSGTNAGQYLMEVKEQFQPEVFFDMIMYVELSLEMKIENQSRMLLSQAGFDPDEKELSLLYSKKAELEALKKNIGKTGTRVLAPLVQDKI